MTDTQLFPITQAAVELVDIGTALKNQDEDWFHGNQRLGEYYQQLGQQLSAFLEEQRK